MRMLGLMLVLLAGLSVGRAKTIYVETNGVDARTGEGDWTNAVLTISNGVAEALRPGACHCSKNKANSICTCERFN